MNKEYSDVSDVYSTSRLQQKSLQEHLTIICPCCHKEIEGGYQEVCPYCGQKIEKSDVKFKSSLNDVVSKPLFGEYESNTKQDENLTKNKKFNENQILLS